MFNLQCHYTGYGFSTAAQNRSYPNAQGRSHFDGGVEEGARAMPCLCEGTPYIAECSFSAHQKVKRGYRTQRPVQGMGRTGKYLLECFERGSPVNMV
jgi:hypothetical protein